MELEQLKNIWTNDTGPRDKKNEDLLQLLSKPSNSPIAKMKRNLRWELVAVIILYGLTVIYYFFAFEGKMVELSWFMMAIGVFFVIYYYRKNKLLNEMQCVACRVKSNLELQLKTLEKYVRFYLVAGNILFPLSLLFVGYIGFFVYPERLNTPKTLLQSPAMQNLAIKYAVVIVFLSIGVFFLNKWYVNRLYGRHIKKLKEILIEMKDD
jgi:Flp pilus assembly protein TadB